MTELVVVDGENHILGRLGSYVAKLLLSGKRVVVLNAEKVVISGKKHMVFEEFDKWMEIRGRANPRKGPKHYRRPDDLVRQTIAGMLPKKKYKGRAALRRLRVYIGIPAEFKQVEKVRFPDAMADKLACKFVTVGEVSKHLGAKF